MEQSPQETKFLQLFFFFFLVELMFFFPQTVSLEKESTKKNLQMYSAGGSLSVCSEIFLFLSGCLTEGKKLDAYFVVIRIQSHSIPNKIRWQQNLLHTRHYHSPSVAFSSDTTCAWRTECNQTEGEKSLLIKRPLFSLADGPAATVCGHMPRKQQRYWKGEAVQGRLFRGPDDCVEQRGSKYKMF